MALNYFNRIRRSYFVNILFSTVFTNLIAFGQPLQHILNKRAVLLSVDNYVHSEPEVETKQVAVSNNLARASKLPHGVSVVQNPDTYAAFFASESLGVIGNSSGGNDENPDDNFFTIIIPQDVILADRAAILSYDLYGVESASQTTKSINYNPSYGGKIVSFNNSWNSVKEIIPANQLVTGKNEIFFNRRADAAYQYKIKNLRIELISDNNDIEASVNQAVTNYNGIIYLSNKSDLKPVSVKAGDKIFAVDGVNGENILKDVPKNIKTLEVSYHDINDQLLKMRKKVAYHEKDVDFHFTQSTLNRSIGIFNPDNIKNGIINFKKQIALSNICAENTKSTIIIEGLEFKDVRNVNADLTNVTAGEFTAYNVKKQYIPGGEPLKLHLKYNPDIIPDGYTAKDIRTYYFDRNLRTWKQLDIDSLDYKNNEIISSIYDNDTDYINGVIKVPDSPETGSFAPTAITDMKVADPAAGVVSIPPPTPNSTGNAATSFPIKLPQGRNGMQPSLEVTYNSEAGSGWMGVGWNLTTPAITLNTKWGVPLFESSRESELYSLNGSDLVLKENSDYTNPHRHPSTISRSPVHKDFYLRKEGAYNKITRHGSDPKDCWWEVSDKQGNRSFYGNNNNGNNSDDSNFVIKNDEGNIVHWALSKMVDPHGNAVEYYYTAPVTTVATTEPGTSLIGKGFYLDRIEYTKQVTNTTNFYKVLFRTIDRQDITTDYRNGYIKCDNKLLDEIQVSMQSGSSTNIRTYKFIYSTKAFQKQQLIEIKELDNSGDLFYSNIMEYYDYTQLNVFDQSSPTTWSSPSDDIGSGLSSLGAPSGIIPVGSILGSSTSSGFNAGGRVGGGIGLNFMSIGGTLGLSGNYSENTQKTKISFIDVNGDGLPDKVFQKNGQNRVYYRPNLLTSQTPSNSFGAESELKNITSLSHTKSSTFGGGVDGNIAGLGVGKSKSETTTETDNYFTDFNGDGLPDMVRGNRVHFNATDIDANNLDPNLRSFKTSSSFTENTVVSGTMDGSIIGDLQLPTLTQLRQQHPQFDHVQVWEAPYTGIVNISGIANLIQKNENGQDANNFKLTIEKKPLNPNSPTSLISLTPGSLSTQHTGLSNSPITSYSSMTSNGVSVFKGDLIFFRVHNLNYGSGGVVNWNPVITYTATLGTNLALNSLDDNGKNMTVFNRYQDFVLQNGGSVLINGSHTSVSVSFNNLTAASLQALNLSDNVRFVVKRTRVSLTDGTPITVTGISSWSREFNPTTNSLSGSVTFNNVPVNSQAGYQDIFTCTIESDSNISGNLIVWNPKITSSGAGGSTEIINPGINYQTYDENVNGRIHWIPKSDLPQVGTITNDGANTLMTISHDFTPLVSALPDNTRVKVNWIVKSQVLNASGVTIVKRLQLRTLYVNKTTDNNFTLSINENGSGAVTPAHNSVNITKQQIKDILNCPTGRLYSAFYVSNREVAVNNSTAITLALTTGEQQNYFGYQNKVISNAFFSLKSNIIGNICRGWNEFLYNGGYKFPSLTDSYGNYPIDMAIFNLSSQQSNTQALPDDFDPNDASAGDIGTIETTPRYMMYSQNVLEKKFLNKSIINSGYGYNMAASPAGINISLGRFGIGSLMDSYINPATFFSGQTDLNYMFAIKQRSKSVGKAESFNAGYGGYSVGGTSSEATSEVLNQYIDLNGDRYPDFITKSKIQFTNMRGGLSTRTIANGFMSSDNSKDFTKGITVAGIQPNSTAGSGSRNKTLTNIGAGVNDSDGSSYDSKQWVDINGDGLTDKIVINKHSIDVWLNNAKGFTDKIIWFNDANLDLTTSWRDNSGGGLNPPPISASFSVGFGASKSTADMGSFLTDVTGDGLPELISSGGDNKNYKYYLNTGRGFSTVGVTLISGNLDNDESLSGTVFGTASYGFPVSLVPPIKIIPSISLGANAGVSEKKATLQDMNGDGLPDIIRSTGNGSLDVKYNTISKNYLLKAVNTPLGGRWTLDYKRDGNTYKMANSKWTLSKIETHDGFTLDGPPIKPNTTATEISYKNPNYDRREREFLGYELVTVKQLNPDNTPYRYTEKQYHNENYYLSGAERRSTLFTAGGQIVTEQTTLYNLMNAETPVVTLTPDPNKSYMIANNWKELIDRSRLFLAPVRIVSSSYENGSALNATKEFIEYDSNGNLKKFRDLGEGVQDAYRTEIDYYGPLSGLTNGTGFPSKISVYKNTGGNALRQREALYNSLGKLIKVTTLLNSTESRIVTFEYDTYGNMIKFRDNDNLSASSAAYFVDITYDNVINTYPIKVKNLFNEESRTVYNYLFGIPVLTTDMNSQKMRTRIDDRGRVIEVTGPNEMSGEGTADAWTIRTEYKGEGSLSTTDMSPTAYMINAGGSFAAVQGVQNKQHFAVTKHFDPETFPGTTTPNQFVTISIVDGFGQPVQVKKSHISTVGTVTSAKWLISGPEIKDAFGRTLKSHDPFTNSYTTDPASLSTSDKSYVTPVLANAVTMEYDVRDRVVSVAQPDEDNAAQMQYAIEENMFMQKQIDEKGNYTQTYTDIRGRQRKVKQQDALTTTFSYNAINELVKVTNNEGFTTEYFYDTAGRKTKVHHPDRGITTFKYNKAGNVTEQSTANLAVLPGSPKISYKYDASRLIEINYPLQLNTQNNVKYVYGKKSVANDTINKAVGRVVLQQDASGVQVFSYGNMGEVTKSLRSVVVAGSRPHWFYTQWTYDSWNRVQQITYPDLETVNYVYNKAGMLESVKSVIPNISGALVPDVVSMIRYNNMGQRSKITYGNNAVTDYTYDTRQRLSTLIQSFGGLTVNKKYSYDEVSNIAEIATLNDATTIPATAQRLGGPVKHKYTYDDYNRLINAEGGYTGQNDAGGLLRHAYVLDMEYNTNHTIKKKTQKHEISTLPTYSGAVTSVLPVAKTSYELDYSGYGTGAFAVGTATTSSQNYGWVQPHAVRKITENPIATPGNPVAADDQRTRRKEIAYDASGNQTQIKEKVGFKEIVLRTNLWDEENRLMGVDLKPDDPTNRPVAVYTYDAAGERIIRHNFDRSDIYVNGGQATAGYKDNIMIYPSGLLMAKVLHLIKRPAQKYDQLQYTKHYYIGAERIAARTGTLALIGYYPESYLPQTMKNLVSTHTAITRTNAAQAAAVQYVINKVFGKFTAEPPVLGSVPIENIDGGHAGSTPTSYYFHPDHLGSSSYVSRFKFGGIGLNASEVTQHMEYLPFGETLMDEHINSKNSPFKYNGKEFDEETGNYYYGARYYDPKWSNFISVDPLAEKTMSSYGYCNNNPIRFTDPTGMSPEEGDDWIKNKVTGKITWNDDAISHETAPAGSSWEGPETESQSNGLRTTYEKDKQSYTGIAMADITINVTQDMPFTIGDTGPYGPYLPDAVSLSGSLGVNGFFFQADVTLGVAITNDDAALIVGGSINMGPATDLSMPGIKGGIAFGMHDKMGSNNDVLQGLAGKDKGHFGGIGIGGSYTESIGNDGKTDPNGVSNTSINIGPTAGFGTTQSNGDSFKASNGINWIRNNF